MRLKKNKVLALLERNEETKKAFVERADVSRQAFDSWMNGSRHPKIIHVRKIADALGCDVEDIAEYENNGTPEIASADDYVTRRIAEICAGLDRAARAELLANAERIAAVNTRREVDITDFSVSDDMTHAETVGKKLENSKNKIDEAMLALMINECDNPTSTPRGKMDGRMLLDVKARCPRCKGIFYIPRLKKGTKQACPICGQHVVLKK